MPDPTYCAAAECERPSKSRGLCQLHYKRLMKHGSTEPPREANCLWCGADILHMQRNAKYCCKDHKKLASGARFRERNPGYFKRYKDCPRAVAWREGRRAAAAAYGREYARTHREERAAYAKRWRATKRDYYVVRERNRRALKLDNPGSVGVSLRDWRRLCERYRQCCAYCGEPGRMQMEHVIPLTKGGRHAIGNILPACRTCNISKNARYLVDWRYRMAYRLIDEVLAAGEEHPLWTRLLA